MDERRITVGEAARRAGVSAKAVRLYEARGILPPRPRTAAGYRIYDDHDIRLLRFVRGARALGLSLKEIEAIVGLRRSGERPSERVLQMLARHVETIDRTVGDLAELRTTLTSVLEGARAGSNGAEGQELCATIAAIDHRDAPQVNAKAGVG